MRTPVIRIGNSRGIRLPKAILAQCNIQGEVDMEVKGHTVVIKPVVATSRAGWDEAFKSMAQHGDDVLLDNDVIDVDEDEWTWE